MSIAIQSARKKSTLHLSPKRQRQAINPLKDISQPVWNYQIGGYQVCGKWLKDRKGRVLSLDEIQTYCRIVTSIQKTLEIQKSIDELYEDLERELI